MASLRELPDELKSYSIIGQSLRYTSTNHLCKIKADEMRGLLVYTDVPYLVFGPINPAIDVR